MKSENRKMYDGEEMFVLELFVRVFGVFMNKGGGVLLLARVQLQNDANFDKKISCMKTIRQRIMNRWRSSRIRALCKREFRNVDVQTVVFYVNGRTGDVET